MPFDHLCTPSDHQLSRRQWLGAAAGSVLGAGALATPVVADQMKKKEKQVLFIWLDGGMSQLESWDPKPNSPFGGPFRPIQTSVPGVQVCELLPRSARLMHKLTVVRSLSTKDNSHSAGVDRIQRGDPKPRGVTYPFFGSAVVKLLGPGSSGLPPYVWVKPMSGGFVAKDAGFLGPKYGALAFGDGKPPEGLLRHESLSAADDLARNALRQSADKRYSAQRRKATTEANTYVYDMAAELAKRADIFDARTYSPKDVERYGPSEIGRHMLVARRFLEAGVRFVKVNSYGWDSHGDNFNQCASSIPKFDQAFAAMIEDLADRGMLENVLVIQIAEFGRTPRINGHLGRDHWPEAWSFAMAGCGVKPGVIGKTNDKGYEVATEPYDIGAVFHTWFHALGINSLEVEYDNAGQPLPIAHEEMKPIKEALA
jgi:hypothetical protein